MDDAILKYGEKAALFAVVIYMIYSDNKDRQATREWMKAIIEYLTGRKENQ